MKSYWTEIKADFDECEGSCGEPALDGDIAACVCIDSWKTKDCDEQGEVIAWVVKTKNGDVCVVYGNKLTRHDEYAQKIIQATVERLRATQQLIAAS